MYIFKMGFDLHINMNGPKTWGAIHRALCALVCEHLDIAGTATPTSPKWLKPVYGFPAGQGVYSCGESFPVDAVGRDGVESEENRRVELVFAPKDLEVKAAPSKSVNMTEKDCVLYDLSKVCQLLIPIQTITASQFLLEFVAILPPNTSFNVFLSNSAGEKILLESQYSEEQNRITVHLSDIQESLSYSLEVETEKTSQWVFQAEKIAPVFTEKNEATRNSDWPIFTTVCFVDDEDCNTGPSGLETCSFALSPVNLKFENGDADIAVV
jgi:hypothetical protein